MRIENHAGEFAAACRCTPDASVENGGVCLVCRLRAENERLEGVVKRVMASRLEVGKVLLSWCHSAGWAAGHGDTPADIAREMMSQHCDERSHADLTADGGLPEARSGDGPTTSEKPNSSSLVVLSGDWQEKNVVHPGGSFGGLEEQWPGASQGVPCPYKDEEP